MDAVIEAIHAALADNATPEARAAGVVACRAVLARLDPQPAATPAAAPVPNIAGLVGALGGVPADQLLDLAITKLRALAPAGSQVAAPAPIKFQMVPVRRRG